MKKGDPAQFDYLITIGIAKGHANTPSGPRLELLTFGVSRTVGSGELCYNEAGCQKS